MNIKGFIVTSKKVKSNKKLGRFNKYYLILILFLIIFSITSLIIKHNQNNFCANSISCINNLSGTPEKNITTGIFLSKEISIPKLNFKNSPKKVLGTETPSNKRILVNITQQKLLAYEGTTKIYEFAISSGKWGKTPTGNFNIWIKLNATRMTGGSKNSETYYDLPNVPYTMYFYNSDIPKSRGYGIHGAYWHNNFGHPMSHGCINLSVDDSKTLYEWTNPITNTFTTYVNENNPGTPIYIYGTAPME